MSTHSHLTKIYRDTQKIKKNRLYDINIKTARPLQ